MIYEIGTLLQSKKYEQCIGMIIDKQIDSQHNLWFKINFAGTNKGLFRPSKWLWDEIVDHFDIIG